MSPRNKKKQQRKPKANAVKSKRRRRKPVPMHAPAAPRDQAEEPEHSTEPEESARIESGARWAAEDPTAIWWDDVWPFKEETPGEPTLTATAEEEFAATDEPDDQWDEESALAVPPPLVLPAPRSPGLVWIPILVAAMIVGVLAWWATSRGSDEQPIVIHSHPFAAPVRLIPDSSFVRSRVLTSGDIVVKHWIRTSRRVQAVNLRAPPVRGLKPQALSVSDLVVASDGLRMPVLSPVDPDGVMTFELPPTKRIYVRYRLTGVVQSSGGPDTRALARITALDVSTSTRLVHTTLNVVGAQVLALACTPKGRDVPTPCGTKRGGRWSASLGPGQQDSQVMAQLNLS
jgi:hypothetical protein